MIESRLALHIEAVCKPNLKDRRVTRCAACPFEDAIIKAQPMLKSWFARKRRHLPVTLEVYQQQREENLRS